jgi:tetratricopeptide (TPR) repeat protein
MIAITSWIASLTPPPVFAQGQIPGYPNSVKAADPREVAMLPRYCIHTQIFRDRVPGGNSPDEISRWTAVMGDTFNHMHHYCLGLMNFNRATLLARQVHVRHFYLDDAVREFDYVLERAPKNFILLPEILTKKGEALIRRGVGARAIEPLELAARIKPDYWPPYAHLSDQYKEAGDLKKAREWLETGLTHSPDANGLQRRLKELDDSPAANRGRTDDEAVGRR